MKSELQNKLRTLADKYECASFCDQDPSQFLKHYKNVSDATVADTEAASFIAAMLAFGSRTQFIPKINEILQMADSSAGTISKWLADGRFKKDFPHGDKKFYRFYSYDDIQIFFEELAQIIKKSGSLGEHFRKEWEGAGGIPTSGATPTKACTPTVSLSQIISSCFPKSRIVPKGKNSANKRIHMFLRWMVRQNSPVDLGIWSWYPQSQLLIPLDVHVMQQAVELGLIPPNATASNKTAHLLTDQMKQIFPNDPSRADYALFGLGVDLGIAEKI